MIEKTVQFQTSDDLVNFCNICQRLKSDIDVMDSAAGKIRIDGKSLLGLMSIRLGVPMQLLVRGEDEETAHEIFAGFERN